MSAANFRNIAVIGAGTMGSGIAAQIANAGHNVLLLDLDAKSAGEKTPAENAIDRLLASDPPQLMSKKNIARITTGVIDDDFEKLADCDWIIEAVVERLDIKKALYRRLDAVIGADCICQLEHINHSDQASCRGYAKRVSPAFRHHPLF